ncbi:MAG: hypothetical protein HY825_16635 [Acidobacteria bacterium]|nr:hypothetical protein [Acidobacteriota bacterium]
MRAAGSSTATRGTVRAGGPRRRDARTSPALRLVLAALALGCGHDWSAADVTAAADEAGGTDGDWAGDAGHDGEDELVEEADEGAGEDEAEGAPDADADAAPFCGDGVVNPGEECDTTVPQRCTTGCGTIGGRPCRECRWAPECEAPAEACNDRDDDCDGLTDEDFECRRGETKDCRTVCDSAGKQNCGDACVWEPACVPPAETCNGVDDDCDAVADEDFECVRGQPAACGNPCGVPGVRGCDEDCRPIGACCSSTERCSCTPPACDDDCDGLTDEGCPAC